TVFWSYVLLGRSAGWHPALRASVLVFGLACAAFIAFTPRLLGRAAIALASASLVVSMAGPAAYAIYTAATPHRGAIPTAGQAVAGARFGGPGGGFPGGPPQAAGPGG